MTSRIATAILTGLWNQREHVDGPIEGIATKGLGVRGLEESWVYQDSSTEGFAEGEAMDRAKGELEEARAILLRLGRKKLGQPDELVLARIAGLTDLEYLYFLINRILDVSGWEKLLDASES